MYVSERGQRRKKREDRVGGRERADKKGVTEGRGKKAERERERAESGERWGDIEGR